MLYLYSLSIPFSFIFLILLFLRVVINRNSIEFKSNKYNWKLGVSLVIICIVPVINVFFALTSAYISILMKKANFLKFMNE